jgi:predicted metal-dependent HD superfamily phosphohydrolase
MDQERQTFLEHWMKTWNTLAKAVPNGALLLQRYEEAGRHYHNIRHVVECLKELETFGGTWAANPAVRLALFYHDAVYDPQAADNEKQSAELARSELAKAVDVELVERVVLLVLVTDHKRTAIQDDERVMVDTDLAILGQPWEIFERYEGEIRREYAHVPEEAFREGRIKVLRSFLGRERIYLTQGFRQQYEHKARVNLKRSLELLAKVERL